MDVDRTFWEILNADHLALLRNAVEWAADEPAPVIVRGAGVLDISVWRQALSFTVHLVNLNNPMMMKGPYREIIPTGAFTVELAVPSKTRVVGVTLLERGQKVPLRVVGGRIHVDVPGVALHEVIAIDVVGGP
jgi:hypothetical protein